MRFRLTCAVPVLVAVIGCGKTPPPEAVPVSNQPKPKFVGIQPYSGPAWIEVTQPAPATRVGASEWIEIAGRALIPDAKPLAFPGHEVHTEFRSSRNALAGGASLGFQDPDESGMRQFRGKVVVPYKPGKYTFHVYFILHGYETDPESRQQIVDMKQWYEVASKSITLEVEEDP